ncbi:protein draper-like, partial [Mercenaria mercenaria]|uniref:protein draper-like n=1 Tax=Mercenaria mercenaria TaxID=6596 RepID=UPI00234E9F44
MTQAVIDFSPVRIILAECPYRFFGQNCASKCHCVNNTSCSNTDGTCTIGYCDSGWQGSSCSQECTYRTFGQNCSSECHCSDNSTCKPINGTCNNGYCEAGWQGSSCSEECEYRTFGPNCSEECHCFDNSTCHPVSGACHIGYCEAGWQGPACNKARNILLKLKGQVNTQMSSVAHNWTSERAIDGRVGPDPNTCHCCSGTKNSQLSWWTLDLSKKISIKSVIIYSRDQESFYQDLKDFQLYLTNNTLQDASAINTNSNTNITDNAYEIDIPNTLARYVTIKRPGVLTICEIMIFEGECMLGTYGDECIKECHCADNKPCNKESGFCKTTICKTGWKGPACDQGCPQDRFGDDCKERCFCAGGTCTNNYGVCPGNCRQGFHGPHCNIAGSAKQSEKSSSGMATVGVSVGGSIAFVSIAVAVLYLFVRYRRKIRYQKEHKNDYTTPSVYIQQSGNSDYDTLETIQ